MTSETISFTEFQGILQETVDDWDKNEQRLSQLLQNQDTTFRDLQLNSREVLVLAFHLEERFGSEFTPEEFAEIRVHSILSDT